MVPSAPAALRLALEILCLALCLRCPLRAMAPGASKFDPPKQDLKNERVDPAKFKKLAVRVEEALQQNCLFSEPKQIAPEMIIVAPYS